MNKPVIGRAAGVVLGLLLGLAVLTVPGYALYVVHSKGVPNLSAVIDSQTHGCR